MQVEVGDTENVSKALLGPQYLKKVGMLYQPGEFLGLI